MNSSPTPCAGYRNARRDRTPAHAPAARAAGAAWIGSTAEWIGGAHSSSEDSDIASNVARVGDDNWGSPRNDPAPPGFAIGKFAQNSSTE